MSKDEFQSYSSRIKNIEAKIDHDVIPAIKEIKLSTTKESKKRHNLFFLIQMVGAIILLGSSVLQYFKLDDLKEEIAKDEYRSRQLQILFDNHWKEHTDLQKLEAQPDTTLAFEIAQVAAYSRFLRNAIDYRRTVLERIPMNDTLFGEIVNKEMKKKHLKEADSIWSIIDIRVSTKDIIALKRLYLQLFFMYSSTSWEMKKISDKQYTLLSEKANDLQYKFRILFVIGTVITIVGTSGGFRF